MAMTKRTIVTTPTSFSSPSSLWALIPAATAPKPTPRRMVIVVVTMISETIMFLKGFHF